VDEEKRTASFETFEEARRIDPSNLNAHYLHASYLDRSRRSDEAYPLLEKALALAPGSTSVRQAYWSAIQGSRQLGAERKREILERDMDTSFRRTAIEPTPFSRWHRSPVR
jgi:Flp pilus assembly protein TadD